jgi:hypothetical protein
LITDAEGKTMRVVTNLRDISAEKIAAMYQAKMPLPQEGTVFSLDVG